MTEQEQCAALLEWFGSHRLGPPISLDVLHEMEKRLTDEQCKTYHGYLKDAHLIATHPAAEWIFHMTAAHRREALLRTLNLWKE